MTYARVLLLCAVAALGACHGDSSQSPSGKAAPAKHASAAAKKGPTPEELTAGMVQAVTQGKSQVPVTVKFDLLQRPAVGQALDIDIAMLPQITADQATVQVSASDGLNVAADSRQIDFAAVEATQVYRHKISVTPTAAGVYFVDFAVTLAHDAISESRSFSVPIIVEAAAGANDKG
jgi:ethanolamine ammonia-lyase small subunit